MRYYLKTATILLVLSLSSRIMAQSDGFGLNLGYTYVGTNMGYMGVDYAYRTKPDNWEGINVGLGILYGGFHGDFKLIPELHVNYSTNIFLAELSSSTRNFNPSIGVHLFNMLRMKLGYSFEFGKQELGMKGITFGVNILLSKDNGFYDKFNIL